MKKAARELTHPWTFLSPLNQPILTVPCVHTSSKFYMVPTFENSVDPDQLASTHGIYMGLVIEKPVFEVSEHVRLKSDC